MTERWPILEFDHDPDAIVHADILGPNPDMPVAAVGCYFPEIVASLAQVYKSNVVDVIQDEAGIRPIYAIEIDGRQLAVFHPGVGAPSAAASLEIVIARGVRSVIFCGRAGIIADNFNSAQFLVANAAVRDEGTSYHYLPPAREVAATSRALSALSEAFSAKKLPFLVGKTWTTDAPFRETDARVATRRKEGCSVVEMEAAAVFAVAQARGIDCGCAFYGADIVSRASWRGFDQREPGQRRETLFGVAITASLALRPA